MRVRPTSSVHVDRPRAVHRRAVASGLVLAGGLLLGTAGGAAAAPGGPLPGSPPTDVASALGVGAVGPVAGIAGQLRTTAASVKKINCAALTRKAKRAKGASRRYLRQQARRCPAENKRMSQALKAIGDGRYVGARGDGEQVDWTLCANGKYRMRTTGSYGTGVSTGSKWQIVWAEANGPKGFTVVIEDRQADGATSIGMSLRGGQWGVGISSFSSEVNKIGAVERTDATADCAAL